MHLRAEELEDAVGIRALRHEAHRLPLTLWDLADDEGTLVDLLVDRTVLETRQLVCNRALVALVRRLTRLPASLDATDTPPVLFGRDVLEAHHLAQCHLDDQRRPGRDAQPRVAYLAVRALRRDRELRDLALAHPTAALRTIWVANEYRLPKRGDLGVVEAKRL